MSIDLQRFCAVDNDERKHLHAPWREGKWIYATNGHLCVRVDAAAHEQPCADYIPGKHPNAATLFIKWFDEQQGDFMLLPPLPALPNCRACDGRARHHAIKCMHCTDGGFMHGLSEYDCRDCEYEPVDPGWIAVDDTTQPTRHCTECFGRGFQKHTPFIVGGQSWELGYLVWLSALPQLRIRTHEGDPTKNAAAFIFDGGQALLMPRTDQA